MVEPHCERPLRIFCRRLWGASLVSLDSCANVSFKAFSHVYFVGIFYLRIGVFFSPSILSIPFGGSLSHWRSHRRPRVFQRALRERLYSLPASKVILAELFERIGRFFARLETYTEVAPTTAMTEIITEIMVEVLRIFGIATKEIKRGLASECRIGGI